MVETLRALGDQCECSADDAEYRANASAYSPPEEANDGENQCRARIGSKNMPKALSMETCYNLEAAGRERKNMVDEEKQPKNQVNINPIKRLFENPTKKP